MPDRTQYLDRFFTEYEARFNQALKGEKAPDIEGTMHAFAPYFLESGPLGIVCNKNDEKFKEAIPENYRFYEDIGITSMKIASKETTFLDEFHTIVKIHWEAGFIRHDRSTDSITFDILYFLLLEKSEYKIFACITGDEQRVLKENGLV